MNTKLKNACDGNSASQGGLNVPELKKELIIQLPNYVDEIKKAKRNDLEQLCQKYLLSSVPLRKKIPKKMSKKMVKKVPKKIPTVVIKKQLKPLLTKEYVSAEFTDYVVPKLYEVIEKPKVITTKPKTKLKLKLEPDGLSLKEIIGAWTGLQTMTVWNLGREYLVCKKNEIIGCKIPKDPIKFMKFINKLGNGNEQSLKILEKEFPDGFTLGDLGGDLVIPLIQSKARHPFNIFNVVRLENLANKPDTMLYENGDDKCYIYKEELMAEECIGVWADGAVITNMYDGKKYKMIEIIPCPINCTYQSYIYQDVLIPTRFYFVFGFGRVIEEYEKYNATILAMYFVLEYLPKYLKQGNTVTFVGHSVGFTNSFMISQALAYTNEDFDLLYNAVKTQTSDMICAVLGTINYNVCNTLYGDDKTKKDNFWKIPDYERRSQLQKTINDNITKFREYRDANVELIKNINFVGSGGAPLISSEIPPTDYRSVNSYYNKKIIHFGYAEESDVINVDPFLIKNGMINTPVYLLIESKSDMTELKMKYVEFEQLKKYSEGDFNIHEYKYYRPALQKLIETPKLMHQINKDWKENL